MKNLIHIDDEKEYTLTEFAQIVRRALSAAANECPDSEYIYPGREVYFAVFDLLGYVNQRIKGEFRLIQSKHKEYQILYVPEKSARSEANKPLMHSRNETAKLLEEMTGRRPNWADSQPRKPRRNPPERPRKDNEIDDG